MDCCGDFVNPAQNCVAGGTKSALIAEQTRTPVGSHGERLNFEGELAHVHIFAEFSGGLRFACGVFQMAQPLFHELDDAVANASGSVVEFERCGGKEASAGESFIFSVGEPIFAERAKQTHAAESRCGEDDAFDEDVASFVHDGALEIFFRAEVGEEAALADAEGGSELSDGEGFETFDGGDIDGFAEDGVAGFEAAGAASGGRRGVVVPRGGAGYGSLFACAHFDAWIIARPFVLLQAGCDAGGSVRGLLQSFNTEGTEKGGGHGELERLRTDRQSEWGRVCPARPASPDCDICVWRKRRRAAALHTILPRRRDAPGGSCCTAERSLKIAAIFAASGHATFGLPSCWRAEYDGVLLGQTLGRGLTFPSVGGSP